MVEGDELDTGSGAGGVTPSGDPIHPSSPPVRLRVELSDDQLEKAAKLAARGVDAETIAAALDLKPAQIERTLKSRKGKQRIRWLRGKQLLQEIQHEDEMRELLPKSRKAVRRGLEGAPDKDAAAIGMKVHEAIIQKPPQRIEHTHQGKVEFDLTPIFERLQESLVQIKEAQAGRDPLARVVRGDVGLVQHRPALTAGDETP